VLGAYIVLFPQSRVITLFLLFLIPWYTEIPAIFYLGFWFLIQLFSGFIQLSNVDAGGVAFWAHIGGFVFGVLFFRLFIGAISTRQYPDEYGPGDLT
jgi:membrane associated rhomboid family serine protease